MTKDQLFTMRIISEILVWKKESQIICQYLQLVFDNAYFSGSGSEKLKYCGDLSDPDLGTVIKKKGIIPDTLDDINV